MADGARSFPGLRIKFTLLLALFSAALMAGTMVLVERNLRQSLINENIEKGLGIARGVAFNAEDPLLTGDDLYLFSAVRNAGKSPGVFYAVIVGEQGRIRAADSVEAVGKPFESFFPADRTLLRRGDDYRVHRTVWRESPVFDLTVPIVTVADTDLRLGEIHLGLDESVITEAVARMRRLLAVLTGIALVLGSAAAWLVATFLVRPVNALVEGVRAVGRGDLQQRIDSRRKDEIGVLTRSFNEMAASLQEKEFIKNTFERYVSKPLAEQILRHRDELQLGGEEKEVTILICDIRGFTAMTEKLPPRRVVEMLNTYFTRMVEVINSHDGMVDKFMGDAVMALFGAPLSLGDEPMRAVQAALELQGSVAELNRERAGSGEPPLQVGISISTGSVVAGNVGSKNRMEYTVIGDNVNIASRLQNHAAPGQVLVTEATFRRIEGRVWATPREPVAIRGKTKPVAVYLVEALAAAGEGKGNSTDEKRG